MHPEDIRGLSHNGGDGLRAHVPGSAVVVVELRASTLLLEVAHRALLAFFRVGFCLFGV